MVTQEIKNLHEQDDPLAVHLSFSTVQREPWWCLRAILRDERLGRERHSGRMRGRDRVYAADGKGDGGLLAGLMWARPASSSGDGDANLASKSR